MNMVLPTVAVLVIMMTSFTKGGTLQRPCEGKIPHNNYCYKYIQCGLDENGNPDNKIMDCAFSTYWDDSLKTCVHYNTIPCTKNPCLNFPGRTAAPGNCRGFYDCSSGKSMPTCCPLMYRFDSITQNCVQNDTCIDTCQDEPAPEPSICDKTGNTGDNGFTQNNNGESQYLHCGPGSVYVASDCACNGTSPTRPQPDQCKAEIFLTFDDGTTHDQSGNNIKVLDTKVDVSGGKAIFNGTSKIVIDRFNDVGGTQFLYVAIKYTSQYTGGEMAILSNQCENKADYSIMLTENTGTNEVNFEAITTDKQTPTYGTANAGVSGQQKMVIYRIENDSFAGEINPSPGNRERFTKSAPGSLKRIKCGLQIGYADSKSSFVGEIDEVTIFLCNPN